MSRSSADSAAAETFPARCAHTHLFPGARCRVEGLDDPSGFAAAPRPIGLELQFSDGVVAGAEVVVTARGDALLLVPEYVTDAGTRLSERAWSVRAFASVGEAVELVAGDRAAWPE